MAMPYKTNANVESIPDESEIYNHLEGAYFTDSYSVLTQVANQSALDIFLNIARETPAWINTLMRVRNAIASKLGLKDLGLLADIDPDKSSESYKVGDRVGIFTLHSNSHREVILEDRDRHLDVKVSIYVTPNDDMARVYASTVIHSNNTMGKIYMFFVTPFHKIIVPTTLMKLPRA